MRAAGAPACIDYRSVVSSGSANVVVFSILELKEKFEKKKEIVTTINRARRRRQRHSLIQIESDARSIPLTHNGTVLDAEELRLVITSYSRVCIDIAWKHWKRSREIRCSVPSSSHP